jgi:HD-like signal output (HDOD) protein/prolyl-tRNA editing enzyme YbaK/EbsC (Cys-tRNA(Pro) deacylase)
MSTSITVRRYLDTQDVPYSVVSCPVDTESRHKGDDLGDIPASCVARAMILKDVSGSVMAVIPVNHSLNLDALNRQLHRKLKAADVVDYESVFSDCTPGVLPALGEAYGFETVIDDSLLDQDFVYVASGNDGELICMTGQDFRALHSNAWYGNVFSQISERSKLRSKLPAATQPSELEENSVTRQILDNESAPSVTSMRQRVERLTNLPGMPSLAQKIMQLNANPYAHADDLAKLVEKDPSLAAQIIRYAQSPFYGYQGKISSIRQAISRVLGYDMVMNIALGVSSARPFKIQLDGPLGMNAFWRHATYSATVAQSLCGLIPRANRPQPGTAYLAGLLHNFGFLLLGHSFPKEFAKLHNAVIREPDTPIIELEQSILGVTHAEIGAWLMESWNMPAEIVTVQREHHNPNYKGVHANYVQLVILADRLLKGHDMGDASSEELPADILASLKLDEQDIIKVLDRTIENHEDLDSIVRQLVA